MILASGTSSILPLLYVKERYPDAMSIYYGRPVIDTKNFDLVIVPKYYWPQLNMSPALISATNVFGIEVGDLWVLKCR